MWTINIPLSFCNLLQSHIKFNDVHQLPYTLINSTSKCRNKYILSNLVISPKGSLTFGSMGIYLCAIFGNKWSIAKMVVRR